MKKVSLVILFVSLFSAGWCLKNPTPSPDVMAFRIPGGGIFSFFNAHRAGHMAVDLMWKVSPSAHVVSFQIEKSFDGQYFDPVGGQPNVRAASSNWRDINAYPGFNYYRIAATMSNGDVVYSDVQMVHIRLR